jgi:diguanylate cyclase (GGDEF)-like protein
MNSNFEDRELSEFQLRNIKILTHLLKHDAVSDDIIDCLHQSELDYFSLIDKYDILQQKVNIDEKTNLLKFKKDYLTQIIKTASRIYYGMNAFQYHITLARFDIDDFSIFNNRYGHDLGDEVLVRIADLLHTSSRPTDYAIRFGGEEFDVILPSTDIEGARLYMEKIYEKVRNLRIFHQGKTLKVTLSAGLSSFLYRFDKKKIIQDSEIQDYFKTLQSEADNALYEAKYLGKDRYCIYSKEREEEYRKIRKQYTQKKTA